MSNTKISTYRERVEYLIGNSMRFAGLYGTGQGQSVASVFVDQSGKAMLELCEVVDAKVPSIVDIVPAAQWDEREAHDLYGIVFEGHEPLRPLVNHDSRLEKWTVATTGGDVYQVAVGPTHAGIIESGHFRFHVVGDRILHLDTRLFYKHRGLEKASETKDLTSGIEYVKRACMACSVANGLSYAHACEVILGLRPSMELRRVRTILLELERLWNHLNDLAQGCAGVGMAVGNAAFCYLVEQARQINNKVSGHRFLAGSIRVGASSISVDSQELEVLSGLLSEMRTSAESHWRELTFNSSFQDRLRGVGILNRDKALKLGIVGPAARASGIIQDARNGCDWLAYDDFQPVLTREGNGDVKSRFEQRIEELWQTFDLLDGLLSRPISPANCDPTGVPAPVGVGIVEGARGQTTCVVESNGASIGRLHLRSASYANWPGVACCSVGNLLPDFPLINKSFELCYACVDR